MTRHAAGRGPSQRQLRVGEEIRHALALLLARGDFREPLLQTGQVTVSEVRVSPDLRNATVFVMPLGGSAANDVVVALRRAAAHLRAQIAKSVALRTLPQLAFTLDTSFDHARRIDDLLRRPEVARDLSPEDEDEAEAADEPGGDKPGAGDPGPDDDRR